jgi:hypothetical protein
MIPSKGVRIFVFTTVSKMAFRLALPTDMRGTVLITKVAKA